MAQVVPAHLTLAAPAATRETTATQPESAMTTATATIVEQHWDWARNTAASLAAKNLLCARKNSMSTILADADDVDHAAAIGLMTAARSYDPDKCEFKSWAAKKIFFALIDITRNKTFFRCKSKRVEHQNDVCKLPAKQPEVEQQAESSDLMRHLVDGIKDTRQKTILIDHFCNGEHYAKLAANHGISKAWAAALVKRAVRQLKESAAKSDLL